MIFTNLPRIRSEVVLFEPNIERALDLAANRSPPSTLQQDSIDDCVLITERLKA